MKTIIIFFLSVILFVSIAAIWEAKNIRKNKIIKLESKIDSLEGIFSRHAISVGDSTLQVITNLNIQGEPYKYMHVKELKKGKNEFYFVLNEGTAVKLYIMKY